MFLFTEKSFSSLTFQAGKKETTPSLPKLIKTELSSGRSLHVMSTDFSPFDYVDVPLVCRIICEKLMARSVTHSFLFTNKYIVILKKPSASLVFQRTLGVMVYSANDLKPLIL